MAKKENGNDAMFPYVDTDDSDQISNWKAFYDKIIKNVISQCYLF